MITKTVYANAIETAAGAQTNHPGAAGGWLLGAAILAGLLWLGRKTMKGWWRRQLNRAAHRARQNRHHAAPLARPVGGVLGLALWASARPDLWWVPTTACLSYVIATAFRLKLEEPVRVRRQLQGAAWAGFAAWSVTHHMPPAAWLAGGLVVAASVAPTWREGIEERRIMTRLAHDRWDEMTEARRLKGLKRGRITRTGAGLDVVVTLGGALDLATLQGKVSQLETGLGTRRNAVRIEPHDSAHKATLRIMTRDPLKTPVRWGGLPDPEDLTITEPVEFATTPFGDRIAVNLRQRILIVGATGSGKSSVQRLLAAPVGAAPDAQLVMFDMKGGAEGQHYEHLGEVIKTADDAEEKLFALEAELKRRSAVLATTGRSTWEPTPQDPVIIVMVDEGSDLIRFLSKPKPRISDGDGGTYVPPSGLDALFTIAEQGRALDIHIWWATQYPKAENIPTQISSQMQCTIALKMRRQRESNVAFGESAHTEGWTAHRLKPKGYLLIRDDDHTDPQECRADWMDESELKKIRPVVVAAAVEPEPVPAVVIPPRPAEPPAVPAPAAAVPAQRVDLDKAAPAAAVQSVPGEEPHAFPATAGVAGLKARLAQLAASGGPVDVDVDAFEDGTPAAAEAPNPALLEAPADIVTALREGDEKGLSVAELAARMGLAKTAIYDRLKVLTDDGRAAKIGRGRYVLTPDGIAQADAEAAESETA